MPRRKPPLPRFIIIGAQKSATRWLRYNLGRHPDIYTADEELAFFNTKRCKVLGEDWYRRQFKAWGGVPIVGEATPGYMMLRHNPERIARRIRQVLPDVRLIALLRNPIDRAHSAMLHHVRRERLPADRQLVELLRNPSVDVNWLGLVAGGLYAESLRPFHRRFGDQLQVFLHDDVKEDPAGLYAAALRHIGADPDFVPDGLDAVIFSNRDQMGDQPPLSFEDRQEIYEYFRQDIRHLQRMIQRDLSLWKPRRTRTRTERPPREPRRVVRMPVASANLPQRHEQVFEWLSARIDDVPPDRYDPPAGDTGSTVSAELRELVAAVHRSASTLRRQPVEPRSLPEARDADELRAAFSVAVAELRDAVADPANLEGAVTADWFGPIGANGYARVMLLEMLRLGWGVAVATDQDVQLTDELTTFVGNTMGWLKILEAGIEDESEPTTRVSERFREFVLDLSACRERARTAAEN